MDIQIFLSHAGCLACPADCWLLLGSWRRYHIDLTFVAVWIAVVHSPAILRAQIDSLINHSLHCIPVWGSQSGCTVLCCVYKITKGNNVNTINYLSTKIIKSLSPMSCPCDYSMEIKLKIRKIERINNNQLIRISIVINNIVLFLLASHSSLLVWFNAMLKIKTNNYTHWRTIRMRIIPFAFWCDQLLCSLPAVCCCTVAAAVLSVL